MELSAAISQLFRRRAIPIATALAVVVATTMIFFWMAGLDQGCVVAGAGVRDIDGYFAAPAAAVRTSPTVLYTRSSVVFTTLPDFFALIQLPAVSSIGTGRGAARIIAQEKTSTEEVEMAHYELSSPSGGGRLYSATRPLTARGGDLRLPPHRGWVAGPKQDDGYLRAGLSVEQCVPYVLPGAAAQGAGKSHGGQPKKKGAGTRGGGGGWGGNLPVGGRGGGSDWSGGSGEPGALAVLLNRPGTALLIAINVFVAWRLSPYSQPQRSAAASASFSHSQDEAAAAAMAAAMAAAAAAAMPMVESTAMAAAACMAAAAAAPALATRSSTIAVHVSIQ